MSTQLMNLELMVNVRSPIREILHSRKLDHNETAKRELYLTKNITALSAKIQTFELYREEYVENLSLEKIISLHEMPMIISYTQDKFTDAYII